MNHPFSSLNPIKKSNTLKSLQSPDFHNVNSLKRNMLDSPSQSIIILIIIHFLLENHLFVLNFLDKEKETKSKKNTNTFRRQLLSQNVKKQDKAKENNQINIKLNFNSEIINNNYNQHIENNNTIKQKTHSESHMPSEDLIKEKDKMISILQKELKINQDILNRLNKERDEVPQSFSESEEIDNRKLLTTKSSMNLTSNGKFGQKLSTSNTNVFSSPNIHKAYASPRCFSSSLNFDNDVIGMNQLNNLLSNTLTFGKTKSIRLSELNTPSNSSKNIKNNLQYNKQIKQEQTQKMSNRIKVGSYTSLCTNKTLQSQCETLKERTKLLLNIYNCVLEQGNAVF